MYKLAYHYRILRENKYKLLNIIVGRSRSNLIEITSENQEL